MTKSKLVSYYESPRNFKESRWGYDNSPFGWYCITCSKGMRSDLYTQPRAICEACYVLLDRVRRKTKLNYDHLFGSGLENLKLIIHTEAQISKIIKLAEDNYSMSLRVIFKNYDK
jgi:hypothetical protein